MYIKVYIYINYINTHMYILCYMHMYEHFNINMY